MHRIANSYSLLYVEESNVNKIITAENKNLGKRAAFPQGTFYLFESNSHICIKDVPINICLTCVIFFTNYKLVFFLIAVLIRKSDFNREQKPRERLRLNDIFI